jgi:hypothetical protein
MYILFGAYRSHLSEFLTVHMNTELNLKINED